MPSAIVHLAVANEVNKKLRRNKSEFLIGAIAPDIAKQIGLKRGVTHFCYGDPYGIPKMDKFLEKYQNKLDNDFVLGYYVHLYTDYLWEKYFISEIYDYNMIKKLDGSTFKCNEKTALLYIYNDYTNLNTRLIDDYNMDLSIFYNELPKLESIIDEIPMNKLPILMNAMSIIIENAKERKDYVFNVENVEKFISTAVDLIQANIEELDVN